MHSSTYRKSKKIYFSYLPAGHYKVCLEFMQPFAAIRQEDKKTTSCRKTVLFLMSCLKNHTGRDSHTRYSAAIKHFIERCKKPQFHRHTWIWREQNYYYIFYWTASANGLSLFVRKLVKCQKRHQAKTFRLAINSSVPVSRRHRDGYLYRRLVIKLKICV